MNSRTKEPAAYASTTKVPVAKTTAEISALLEKIGASQRGVMVDDDNTCAVVMFVLAGSKYRIDVPLPEYYGSQKIKYDPKELRRALADHEQATRSRWRGVLLLLKAKIEAVRLGLSSYEDEFMASLILPNGHTVKESVAEILKKGPPQLEGHHG